MKISDDEIKSKCQGGSFNQEEITQLIQNQSDAEKYRHLKEKMKQVEDESYLLDRLEACDTSGAAEILREFLLSKE